MIHPTDVAVDYIWEYFSKMFFSKETDVLITAIEKILAGAQHRPFHPDTEQHKDFLAAQSKAIAALKKILPW
jgi:cytochrome c556